LQDLGTQTAMYVQTEVALGVFTAAPTVNLSLASPTPTPAGTESTPASVTQTPIELATVTPITGTTVIPLIVVATATPGHPASYTIHAGEFPYCIARRFNVDPGDLLNLNGLSSGEILQPGTTLSIPLTGSFPGTRALQAHPTQYTVVVDDTFYSIACVFGDVDPSAIAAANGLALTAPLTTGQILNIP
jgi:LysM repeat protein